ncbi:sigma-54-dependent Fis family transcriptional regulator [Desulfospira joergensenii]|uniref:sigma-54-dependent Fis family transcriptional regulator n=1 Tax=Desulfospira joergensenii TaxID=53329 RepID=UPI000426F4A5|nr:sigma-54-dependent Fis family transcriptional regulator [Desulfospira joergensenii]
MITDRKPLQDGTTWNSVVSIDDWDRPILRIQKNQKLWESEHFMELYFAQCVEGIWFMEAEEPFLWDDTVDKDKALDYAFSHQHIVRINDAMLQQYKASREQFMGLTLNDFFRHDLENARNMWRQIFDHGKLTCETSERRFRGPTKFAGDTVWFLGDYFCIYNQEGKMVGHFGSQRDITSRKLAEKALTESEKRYRFLTKNVADGIMVVLNWKLVFVNDALLSMFGHNDAGRIVGQDVLRLIAPESRERFKKELGTLQADNGRSNIFQTRCMTLNGEIFWAEVNNAVINWNDEPALLCTIRNINEKKIKELRVRERAENLHQQNQRLRASIKERFKFCNIIGKSQAMQQVYELIIRAADSDANVVIYGESGTGKELVARAIHEVSNRSDKAIVPVNCYAIPDSLLESEFFGYRKGAFTGAFIDKSGYLDQADGGTLFLDEVGDLDLVMQGKLLRAIEGGGYTPIGSQKICHSDFRIIAATNKDMSRAVRKGVVREDFFYRIHVLSIILPPLRERKEDIQLLVEHFLSLFKGSGKNWNIPGHVNDELMNYDWPGNVRELQNVLHRYKTVGKLGLGGNRTEWEGNDTMGTILPSDELESSLSYRETLDRFEKKVIFNALEKSRWNRSQVSRVLGIPRRTLYQKMKRFGLNPT